MPAPIDVPSNQTSVSDMQAALSAQATALEAALTTDLAALEALSVTFAAATDIDELEAAAQALGPAWDALLEKVQLEVDLAKRRIFQASHCKANLRAAGADLS